MTDILMPALSPTMEEGTLARWLIKPGDRVRAGDIIAEIETDKATMEVEAVDEGVISDLLVAAGTEGVKVNSRIATIDAEGAVSVPAAASTPSLPVAPPPSPAMATPMAPSVRRIASERGLDLSAVTGTGRDGRLTKGDALAALEAGAHAELSGRVSSRLPWLAGWHCRPELIWRRLRGAALAAGSSRLTSIIGRLNLPLGQPLLCSAKPRRLKSKAWNRLE